MSSLKLSLLGWFVLDKMDPEPHLYMVVLWDLNLAQFLGFIQDQRPRYCLALTQLPFCKENPETSL